MSLQLKLRYLLQETDTKQQVSMVLAASKVLDHSWFLFFAHGRKCFIIPTKSFVKIGITKIFCYNNKMCSSISKTFGCCCKIFGCSHKKKFVVRNFVAVTKPFFCHVGLNIRCVGMYPNFSYIKEFIEKNCRFLCVDILRFDQGA